MTDISGGGATHVDIVSTQPLVSGGAPKLLKRTQPDDPTIGPQVREGWATYAYMSEPHTMEDCPFATFADDPAASRDMAAAARAVIEGWKEYAAQLEAERDRYREALERIAAHLPPRPDEGHPCRWAQRTAQEALNG